MDADTVIHPELFENAECTGISALIGSPIPRFTGTARDPHLMQQSPGRVASGIFGRVQNSCGIRMRVK
jgi:hypothetical protein